MLYFSYSCIYIHIHVLFLYSCFLYLYSCYIFYIHVFLFTFILYFHIQGYVMHGSVDSYSHHERIWMHHFTFIFSSSKSILCFNNSRQCILVWSSCLGQPRVHLKFPDDVMPSITSTISQTFALSNKQVSCRSEMSFAMHQESHRFGPPSAHIFMFCNSFVSVP